MIYKISVRKSYPHIMYLPRTFASDFGFHGKVNLMGNAYVIFIFREGTDIKDIVDGLTLLLKELKLSERLNKGD